MSFIWTIGRFLMTVTAMFLSLFGFTFALVDSKTMDNGRALLRDVVVNFGSPMTLLIITLPNRSASKRPSKQPLKLV